MMKKGMGSMMVLGSYLTTMRNSVTVIAATSHACWPSFLWNFLMGKRRTVLLWESNTSGRKFLLFVGVFVMCFKVVLKASVTRAAA